MSSSQIGIFFKDVLIWLLQLLTQLQCLHRQTYWKSMSQVDTKWASPTEESNVNKARHHHFQVTLVYDTKKQDLCVLLTSINTHVCTLRSVRISHSLSLLLLRPSGLPLLLMATSRSRVTHIRFHQILVFLCEACVPLESRTTVLLLSMLFAGHLAWDGFPADIRGVERSGWFIAAMNISEALFLVRG